MSKSIRNDLLNEISKKAERIRDKRKSAAAIKTVEELVFEFFRQCDEAKQVAEIENNGTPTNYNVVMIAQDHLEKQIRQNHDQGCKIEVVWETSATTGNNENGNILGVRIVWSHWYSVNKSVEPELYIDVTQMLLS